MLRRRRRRKVRRWGETAHHLLDEGGIACFIVARAKENVLPPEGKEELEVGLVDRMCGGEGRQRGGGLGDRCGHGRAVGREGVELLLTGGGDLRAAPGERACGTGLHDEGDAVP
jgi:hypothetical protein